MNLQSLLEHIDAKKKTLGFRSDAALSKAAGVPSHFLRDMRSGKNLNPSWGPMAQLAAVLKIPLDELRVAAGIAPQFSTAEYGSFSSTETIWVVGKVEAGAFREAIEWAPDGWKKHIELPPDPRFGGIKRFALWVAGTSMNLLYPLPMTLVLCVRFEDLGREPINNEVVIVERRHHDVVEATCKVYVRRPDGSIWLEPRSTDNRHKPILVRDAQGGDGSTSDDSVEVTALVTGAYIEQ